MRGEYCGCIRTLLGKKRMVLRAAGEESFLKVPKDLRRYLQSVLVPGTDITVTGYEVLDDRQRLKRVVSDVRLTESGESLTCAQCPIHVCVKKNCWRNGGRELWQALEVAVAGRDAGDKVRLKAVRCLDHCEKGPNVEWAGHDFHRCSPADADRIVAMALGEAAHPKEKHRS
jgi:(2Fe-2S) ferredoxin